MKKRSLYCRLLVDESLVATSKGLCRLHQSGPHWRHGAFVPINWKLASSFLLPLSSGSSKHALFPLMTSSKRQTMFMRYVFVSLISWASTILSTPLQGPDGQTIELSTAQNVTSLELLFPSNASIQDPNASSGRGLDIQCDGARYGFNPSLSDCEGARSYIQPVSEQFIFGERHTGLPSSTFALPYMIMGGMVEE